MKARWLIVPAGLLWFAVVDSEAAARNSGSAGGPPVIRKLTQAQYRNSIQDIFGPVKFNGLFDPDPRSEQELLIAVGAGRTTVTPSGLEGYDRMAREIAAQVVDASRRDELIPCKPASPAAADDACARTTLAKMGGLLFRRPMTQDELASVVKKAGEAATQTGDFYGGLSMALAGLLTSPQFVFIYDQTEPDPDRAGEIRLTAYAMASRISFLLWNSTPDIALLTAAERGQLRTTEGLAKQVDRMLSAPRLEVSVRAFFSDMLQFDEFDTLEKDTKLYPSYNRRIAAEGREQTLRTLVDLLLEKNGDYRDVFTTRKTFMTAMLASAYGVLVNADYAENTDWFPYEYPSDVPTAGILTQFSFIGLHSHPGMTSPTLRGKALREVLMCQKVPPPPPNVDFSKFKAPDGKQATVREKLALHRENPVCAGCHKITDPIGLAFENFDTSGAYRTTEGSRPIDASGALDGAPFDNVAGLAKLLHDSPHPAKCLVQRAYAYATGRAPTKSEATWLETYTQGEFAAEGYRLRNLFRYIALSPSFYRVTPTEDATREASVAHQKS